MKEHVHRGHLLLGLLAFVWAIQYSAQAYVVDQDDYLPDLNRRVYEHHYGARQRRLRAENRETRFVLGTGWETNCGRAPAANRTQMSRVIDGTRVRYGEFPSFVRVLVEKGRLVSKCGGTLISDRHVLTAAHCIANKNGRIFIRFNDHDNYQRDQHEVQVIAAESVCYERKLYNRLEYDWALLTLKRPIGFNNHIQPACLPRSNPPPITRGARSRCYLVGMGAVGFNIYNVDAGGIQRDNLIQPDWLQKVRVGQSDCGGTERFSPSSDPSRTCYSRIDAPRGGPLSCYGDSGGPVLCQDDIGRWTLVASVSYGKNDFCGIRSRRQTVHRVFADVIKLLPSMDQRCKMHLLL